ncbi:MAG: glycosyltransferase family 2 protein [Ignavibacteriales bacterium]|nr:glycosyltransferase family 2 protein [Ignavibacteriales bacterium]
MAENIKISSIIIARDEEANIALCIKSQRDVVDDIVVLVDSRTTDITKQIALSFQNVNCEIVEWKGYAGTKIYALSKTKYDWVLWIDADERITPELAEELKQFKKSKPLNNAYDVARRAYFLGKWIQHSGWYPARVTRLFNKKYVSFNEKEVHEHLKVEGAVGKLQNDLNHYTDPSIEHYFTKYNSYTSLAAKELFEKGNKATVIDILIRPIFLFCKMYIFRLGFLDGLHGLILAVFSSSYVFTKYCKLWELNRERSK